MFQNQLKGLADGLKVEYEGQADSQVFGLCTQVVGGGREIDFWRDKKVTSSARYLGNI